jgi:hypothetical protein
MNLAILFAIPKYLNNHGEEKGTSKQQTIPT